MKSGMIAFVLMMAVWSAGCAWNGYQTIKPMEYPAVHKMFDVTFGWKKTVKNSAMTIDGYIRNNRYFIISELDMTVLLVDSNGKEKARNYFIFIPNRLSMEELSGFSVILEACPEPGDMIRFLYRYDALDGKDGVFNWRNSFDVPAFE